MKTLTHDEFLEREYTDITGNLPIKDLQDEIELITQIRPHINNIVINYNNKSKKATLYITREDFEKHKNE